MIKISQEALPASDEITLEDLWNVLAKRKALVLAMPVLSLLVATTYLLVTPAVFESRAVIQVGQVGQVAQVGQDIQAGQVIQILHVEVPAILVQRLKEQYRVDDDEANTKMPRITDIRLDKKGSNKVITLLAQDYSAEGAQKQLVQAVQPLIDEHEKLYKLAMDAQRRRLQSLDNQMRKLNEQINKLPILIEAVRKQDPAQAAILSLEKGRLLTQAPNLEAEYTALQLATSDLQSSSTKLMREPTLSNRQIKPRSKLIVVLALTVGLLLGIVSAFIAEFLVKTRRCS